jgi:Fic family protein
MELRESKEIIFVIERNSGEYTGTSTQSSKLRYRSSTLDQLKKEISNYQRKRYGEKKLIRYRYSLSSLLIDLRPYLSYSMIAKYAGMSQVTLSYYLKGCRTPSETSFLKVIGAVQKIIEELLSFK